MDKVRASGEYPYWMETVSGGVSLYNNPQISARYPFYFLGWGLYDTPLHASLTAHRVIFLHLFLLSLNMYILIRNLGAGKMAALVGAVLGAYNLNSYSYMVWIQIIVPYSWLPLAVCGIYLVLENRHPWRGLILGTIGISMLVLASPAQPLIHFIVIAGALTVCASLVRIYRRQPILVPWRNLVLLGIISFILGAPALLPAIREMSQTIRWVGAAPPVIGTAPIPFEHFLLGEIEPHDLAHSMISYPLNHIVGDSWFGLLPMFLALLGVFAYRRTWFIPALALLGTYALFSATGQHLGFAQLNYKIPMINKIREPGRHLVIFLFTFSCLSAFGFQYLYDGMRAASWLRQWNFWIATATFVGLAIVAFKVGNHDNHLVSDRIAIGSCVLFLAVLLASAPWQWVVQRFAGTRWPTVAWAASGLSAIVLGGIVLVPQLKAPLPGAPLAEIDYFDANNLRSHKVLSRLALLPEISEQRVAFQDEELGFQAWCMNGSYYGINSFHSAISPQNYQHFLDNCYTFTCTPITRLWGARYAVCNAKNAPLPPPYKQIDEIEGYRIYEAPDAWPRAKLCNHISGTYNSREEFGSIANAVTVASDGIYVRTMDRKDIAAFLGDQTGAPEGEINRVVRTANKAEYQVSNSKNAMLVFNEFQRGEWKVQVDGRPIDTLIVNSSRAGVLLTPGSHRVSFHFEPRIMVWLLRIQTTTIAMILLGAVVFLVTRFRRSGHVRNDVASEVAAQAA